MAETAAEKPKPWLARQICRQIDKLEGPFFCPKISSHWPLVNSFISLVLACVPTVL